MSETESKAATTPPVEAPPPKKRRRWLRVLVWGTMIIVVLLAGAAIVARIMAPGIIRSQMETRLTEILGTKVTVKDVDLALMRGSAAVNGLEIDPLPGQSLKPLKVGRAGANISIWSLLSSSITVDEVFVEDTTLGMDVNAKGDQSLAVLRHQIEKAMQEIVPAPDEGTTEPTTEEQPSSGKGFRLDKFTVKNFSIVTEDNYASNVPMRTETAVKDFSITDVYVPAPGTKASTVTTFDAKGFTLKLPEAKGYSSATILDVPGFTMTLDTGKIIETKERPLVLIPKIASDGLKLNLETLAGNGERNVPQNLDEYVFLLQNATNPDGAKKLADHIREVTEEPKVEAKPEEKKGFLGTIASVIPRAGKKEEPKPVEAAPAPEEPRAYDRIVIDAAEFSNYAISIKNPDKPRQAGNITDIFLDLRSLTYPYQPGKEATLTLRAKPLSPDAKFALKMQGELTRTEKVADIRAEVDGSKLDLAPVKAFKGGQLDFKSDFAMKDAHGKGSLTFKMKDLQLNNEGMSTTTRIALQPLATMSSLDAPEVKIPFEFDLTGDGSLSDVLSQIFGSIAGQLGGAVGDAINSASKLAQDAAEQGIGAVKDVGKEAAGTLKDAGKGVGDTAKGAVDSIGGLFGKKDKDKDKEPK